ncbi:MAG TPA: hypothetical protein VLE89_07645 [Chlamydiales bacterium]|nr:hypothetical protein [Chlamydiales bacterium]
MKHSFLEARPATPATIQKLAKSSKYSHKVESLMVAGASAPIMIDHSLEMQGVPFMLDGLEYHHGRLKQIEKRMLVDLFSRMSGGEGRSRLGSGYVHEIRAYLNVIGQFIACITSDWFLNYVDKSRLAILCPVVLALLPFRHKDAAHRCIDKPSGETDLQKESFSSLYCYTAWTGQSPKQGDPALEAFSQGRHFPMDQHLTYQAKIAAEHRCSILRIYNVAPIAGIEIPTLDGEIFLEFTLVKQHSRIIAEAYTVIEAAFQAKKRS